MNLCNKKLPSFYCNYILGRRGRFFLQFLPVFFTKMLSQANFICVAVKTRVVVCKKRKTCPLSARVTEQNSSLLSLHATDINNDVTQNV